jgi:uncharacterized protein (TIGR00369 family)
MGIYAGYFGKQDVMTLEKYKNHYSRCSRLLGMDITFADEQAGILEANFVAQEGFANTVGNVQGGVLTAMLDDLMGYALGITLPATQFAPTANLTVSFLRPAQAGVLHGKGQVLKQEGDIYHLAAKLYNASGELVAAATAKAKLGHVSI